MKLRRVMWGVAGAAMSILAPLAMAQVTPAMDRVPDNALVVGTIRNLTQFNTELENFARMLRLPEEAMDRLGKLGALLKSEGVKADGSAAFALLTDDEGDPGSMVAILPVHDYQAMVRSFGGTPSTGLDEITIEGEDIFIKTLDGGFAAASSDRDAVEQFQGKAGSRGAFESMLGASGKSVAEKSDIYFVANIQALKPQIERGIANFDDRMQMLAMMAGGAQQPNTEAMKALANDFARDGRAAVLGLDMGEKGLSVGMAANFAEGSQMARYFEAGGNAGKLISALPNHPFLATYAMDTSSPGIKSLFKRLTELQPAQGQMFGPMRMGEFIEKMDGMAFLWGTTPALMGGLFLNTVAYVQTADPAAYLETTKASIEQMNKQTVQGMTFQTSYQPAGAKVGGRDVDVWSLKMQADPTNPASQQIAQVQMMMFGPGGLSGYQAKADNGVVITYSKNSALLEQALASAKEGNGLTQDEGVQQVARELSDSSTMLAYVGVRNIMEVVIGFMAMMGGPAAGFEVPQDLPPVGFGASSNTGGISGRLFVPKEVMLTIRDLADTMGGEFEEDDEEDAPPPGQPRF